MNVHELHDCTNTPIIRLLEQAFSEIKDTNLLPNYHPDFRHSTSNIFYILENTQRYKNGTYYVLEDSGKFILSTGWNEYEYDPDIALIFTRLYIDPKYRSKLLMSQFILPRILENVGKYKHVYVTVNKYNQNLYNSFVRVPNKEKWYHPAMQFYKNLIPVGEKNIYFTDQYVLEYKPNEN